MNSSAEELESLIAVRARFINSNALGRLDLLNDGGRDLGGIPAPKISMPYSI